MGLLAEPERSWSMGFKSTLQQPKLLELACEMGRWCAARGVPLRTLALQFATRPSLVTSVPIGCRTADEVDQVVDSLLTPLSPRLFADFEETFGARIASLCREDHWYYSKSASKI